MQALAVTVSFQLSANFIILFVIKLCTATENDVISSITCDIVYLGRFKYMILRYVATSGESIVVCID